MSRAPQVVRWGIVVVGGGLAVATVVGFFGSWHWTLDLPANFRVQLALALLLLATLALVVGRRWWAAAITVVMLVNVAVVAPLWMGRSDVPGDAHRLTIGQINLRRDDADATELIEAAAADELGDVFVLMEPSPGWNRYLVGRSGDYQVVDLHEEADAVILTKYPVRQVASLDDAPVLRRLAVTFVVEAPGGPISVLALDASSPGRSREAKMRGEQFQAMADWRATRTGRVILLGDWNATPWSAAYRELVDRTGLRPAEQGFGPLASYPATLGPLGLPIDHQLHSAELTVADAYVGPSFQSLHRSLFVTYALATS